MTNSPGVPAPSTRSQVPDFMVHVTASRYDLSSEFLDACLASGDIIATSVLEMGSRGMELIWCEEGKEGKVCLV